MLLQILVDFSFRKTACLVSSPTVLQEDQSPLNHIVSCPSTSLPHICSITTPEWPFYNELPGSPFEVNLDLGGNPWLFRLEWPLQSEDIPSILLPAFSSQSGYSTFQEFSFRSSRWGHSWIKTTLSRGQHGGAPKE